MSTSNPIFFFFDCMSKASSVLGRFSFWDVSLWSWFVGFIFVGMVVSVFWRGARG